MSPLGGGGFGKSWDAVRGTGGFKRGLYFKRLRPGVRDALTEMLWLCDLAETACDGEGVRWLINGTGAVLTMKTCLPTQFLSSILEKVKMGGVHIRLCVCLCEGVLRSNCHI